MKVAKFIGMLLAMILLASCQTAPSKVYRPYSGKGDRHYEAKGTASWYGRPFHGRRTASGERYDMDKMTAAHRTLPFGAYVTVQNLKNGREVTVMVNDRGPFVKNRLIDLSRAAARQLDFASDGTAPVRVTWIEDPAAHPYIVQKETPQQVPDEPGPDEPSPDEPVIDESPPEDIIAQKISEELTE